jgi:hypothetical protein
MFQLFKMYIESVLLGCCICCNGYTYVASVRFKRFIYFRRMLQVFYLDISYISVTIHIYCKHLFKMFHLFQTYVASVFILML